MNNDYHMMRTRIFYSSDSDTSDSEEEREGKQFSLKIVIPGVKNGHSRSSDTSPPYVVCPLYY